MKQTNELKFDLSALANMTDREREKAFFLMQTAHQIGFGFCDSYGYLCVNNVTGAMVIYSENYSFSVVLPVDGCLTADYIFIEYFNESGEQFSERLSVFIDAANADDCRHDDPLAAIYEWTEEIEAGNGAEYLL